MQLAQGIQEMIGIIFVGVLDGKIVDDQCKSDGPCFMFPQTSGGVGGRMSKWGKQSLESIICKFSCLGQSAHAFANFHADTSVVDLVLEFAWLHDTGWEHVDWNSHVLIAFHRGANEVEIF